LSDFSHITIAYLVI